MQVINKLMSVLDQTIELSAWLCMDSASISEDLCI